MRFEVLLERDGLGFGPKSDGNLNLPRPKLRRMRTMSCVVLLEERFKLSGHSNVIPFTVYKAAECINVIIPIVLNYCAFMRLSEAVYGGT